MPWAAGANTIDFSLERSEIMVTDVSRHLSKRLTAIQQAPALSLSQ